MAEVTARPGTAATRTGSPEWIGSGASGPSGAGRSSGHSRRAATRAKKAEAETTPRRGEGKGRRKEVRPPGPTQEAREHPGAGAAVPGPPRHRREEYLGQKILSDRVPDRHREHEREPAGEE